MFAEEPTLSINQDTGEAVTLDELRDGGRYEGLVHAADAQWAVAENERLWRAVRAYRVNSIYESIDSMQELDEALDALAPIQENP
jgi:hypothetical protein